MLRADPAAGRSRRAVTGAWVDHAVVAAALALLLTGFRVVVTGSEWWLTTFMVTVLVGLTCALVRTVGRLWAAPVALVVELVALAWIFVPQTLAVVVPTPSSLRALGGLLNDAQMIIVEEQAPVAASRPIVLVLASTFGLVVVAADVLLARPRAAPWVGALLLAVFATPALIVGATPSVWLFLAVAALWLVILRRHTGHASRHPVTAPAPRRAHVPALVVSAAALLGAALFPAVSPDISAVAASWGQPAPSVFGRGINPMLELGQDLRRSRPVTALTYTTDLAEPPYLKVATLRDFSGKTWRPARSSAPEARFERDIEIDEDIESSVERTDIRIRELRSTMLPVPYPSLDLDGLEGQWRWQQLGLTVRAEEGDTRGETYSARSLELTPTAEQMRGMDAPSEGRLRPYLNLPRDVPRIIADTAREVTADAGTAYDRALALQDHLRDGGFRYSETAPVENGYDGNGLDVLARFLVEKSGYCVHFSSAMAVMAREVGIPSRIAVGYAPGRVSDVEDGVSTYTVSSDNLHAWTELYFEGAGWTRFDPTPGVGAPTEFEEPAVSSNDVTGDTTPEQAAPTPGPDVLTPDDPGTVEAETASTVPRTALVTMTLLLVLALVPAALRLARRRWRLRGTPSADAVWRELQDAARDHGVPVSPAETPRGFATRLAARPEVDDDALQRLLQRIERSRFARQADAEGDGVADLRAVVASLRRGAPWTERVRARFAPRSLAGRRASASAPPQVARSALG